MQMIGYLKAFEAQTVGDILRSYQRWYWLKSNRWFLNQLNNKLVTQPKIDWFNKNMAQRIWLTA